MKKPLKIISVDGTRGTGKTSQIKMLAKYLKSLGLTCSTLDSGDNIQSMSIAIKFTESFLDNPFNPNGVVILDGSIARPMVQELIGGVSTPKVMDKYKNVIHDYERLDQKHGMVGLLLVMDDIDELNNRITKHRELSGKDSNDVVDLSRESDIVNGMRTFNNHVVSKNIKFHTINIEPVNSIIEINKAMIDYLKENYDIPVSIKDDNDW